LPGFVGPDLNPPGGIVPPPQSPFARTSEVLGGGLARGAVGTAGIPGELSNLVTNIMPFPPAEWAQTGPPPAPTGATLISGLEKAWPPLAETRPRTPGERVLAAGSETVGSALPLAVGGTLAAGGRVPELLSSVLRATGEGFGAGAGGEIGSQVGGPYGQMLGTGLGMLAGGTGVAQAGKLAGRGLIGPAPASQAMSELGMRPRLIPDVVDNDYWREATATASRMPGGARVARAAQDTVNDFGSALERSAQRIESNLGAGRFDSLQKTGQNTQDAAFDWYKNWRNAQTAAENRFSAVAPQQVDLTNTLNTLNAVKTAMPNLPDVANVMTSPTFRELDAGLKASLPGGAPQLGILGVPVAPWQDIRNWRSLVGEELDGAALKGDSTSAAWNRLYGALSDDLGAAAQKAGPQAQAAWNEVNNTYRQGARFRDDTLSKIINDTDPTRNTIDPETAAENALTGTRKGGSVLEDLRAQMPEATDALGAWNLRSMGRAVPSKQLGSGDLISPASYMTGSARLSPEAASALYPANTQAGRDYANLNTVSSMLRKGSEALANPSGTARAAVAAAAPSQALERAALGAGAGWELAGFPGAVAGGTVGAVSPYVPGMIASRAINQPTLARIIAQPSLLTQPSKWVSRATRAGELLPQLMPGEYGR
jgi:hypothetical protein